MSQAQTVDPISLALQARALQVALEEECDLESCRRKGEFDALVKRQAVLDVDHLIALLQATWERLPEDLALTDWESPTTTDYDERTNEVLAIGAAVADVFTVYAETGRKEPRP